MSKTLPIHIPQTLLWLFRLAAHPAIGRSLARDPVAFSAWYAIAGEGLDWPEEVQHTQKIERAKKLSLDRMMKLLTQVNHTMAGRTGAEHARLVLEGYAVHDWIRSHSSDFQQLVARQVKRYEPLAEDAYIGHYAPFAARLKEFGEVLKLSPLEQQILVFCFLTSASDEIAGVFEQLASDRFTAELLWPAMFGANAPALARAMRAQSPLRLSGLLETTGRRVQLARVHPFWVELVASGDSLFDAILEPLKEQGGSGMPARLLPADQKLAADILRNAKEAGVNLLLYGTAALEKRPLLREVVTQAGRQAWRVRRFDNAQRSVQPSLTYVAFHLLAQPAGEGGPPAGSPPPVLVIERPADVLQTAPSEFIRQLFGIELSADDSQPFDEHLLSNNPVPGLWLTSSVEALPPETTARFVFHAPLKKADRAERARAVEERLKGLRLSKAATAEILKLEGVSRAQLDSAVRAARLSGATLKSERDQAIVQAVRRSQKALSRDLTDRMKPSVTHYSLEYLNTAGHFTPGLLLECFQRRPKGSVLLYGPPGTGKTQFTEYLAAELHMPLLIRCASDLLSKYVGEAEKNIAAAFEEAAAEDAVLLLDEGDSFLRSRKNAEHSWEVTQVNELLQKMERFDGICVVCTNLFRGLDAAALRRFTFKIEFRELDSEQRWNLFEVEAGLKSGTVASEATLNAWRLRLTLMKYLTPGDFATVKRQCLALDTQLSPEEWLEQLQIECDIKNADGTGHD